MCESRLHSQKLILELRYVLFPVRLHLLHYFLLRIHISLEVLLICKCLIQLILQARVLLREHFICLRGRLKLNLHVLGCKNLILELTLSLQESGVGLGVLFLLGLVAFNPIFTCFFLTLQNIGEGLDLFGLLLLGYFKLSLNSTFFNFQVFVSSFQINDSPI
jgi:hypothetical protein